VFSLSADNMHDMAELMEEGHYVIVGE
jgi:hypothetical protein